jgi:hypothetical protein
VTVKSKHSLCCAASLLLLLAVAVQLLSRTKKKATYRLTNNSDKPLTCYSVAVDVTYNNGEINPGQESECMYDRAILAPHASLERTTNIEGNTVNHSGVAKVVIEPTLAVFQDGSSQAKDDRSWHILMDNVKSENDGVRTVLDAIQSCGGDSVCVLRLLEPMRGTPPPKLPYWNCVKDAITFFKKSPRPDQVKVYVDHLEQAYESHKPYADLRR